MSDTAKKARAAMKERAQRRAAPTTGDVDASGWREPTMNTTQKVGMQPISKRAFKRGGKVNLKAEGKEAKKHAGRKPRAGGGMTVDDFINRNDKIANEKRGYAHIGGYKKGGKAHTDEAMDKKLIKSMVSKKALKKADGGQTVNREGKGDYAGKFAPDMSERDAAAIMANEKAKAGREAQFEALQGRKKGGKVEHAKGCACKSCGGRMGKAGGGDIAEIIGKGAKYGPLGGFGGNLPSTGQYLSSILGLKKKDGGRAKKAGGGDVDDMPDALSGGYNEDAVNKAIASSNRAGRKIGGKEAKLIHALLKGRTGRKSGGRTVKKGGGGLGIDNPFKGDNDDALDMGAQFLSPAYAIARGKLPGMLGMLTGALGKKRGGKAEGKANYTGGTRPTGGRIAKKTGGETILGDDNGKGDAFRAIDNFVQGFAKGEGPLGDKFNAAMGRAPNAAAGSAPAAGNAMSATPYTTPAVKKAGGRAARKDGGRTKGKTNIHINIETAPKVPPMPMLPPGMMQNKPMPIPPPPAAMPAGMPPVGGPPAGGGVPPGLGVPPAPVGPMMARKAGGRVYRSYKDMDAGAGGGLGRLEKSEIQKRKR